MDLKKSGGYCGITVIIQTVLWIIGFELQYNHGYFIEIVFFNVGLFTDFLKKMKHSSYSHPTMKQRLTTHFLLFFLSPLKCIFLKI